MHPFLKTYGSTLGPIGVPMSDAQAFQLDRDLGELPPEDRVIQKAALPKAVQELAAGERADVSWISTEAVDRTGDVVLATGMDDSHFRLNPLVTLGHSYWMPPVGRSLWRKKADRDGIAGILAKTFYPERPLDWIEPVWQPDECLQLIQAGLLGGKSVGFIGRREEPTLEELRQFKGVRFVVRKWKLIEYAVTPLGVNPEALVQAVSKSFQPDLRQLLGLQPTPQAPDAPARAESFTTLSEIEAHVAREIKSIDFDAIIRNHAEEALSKLQEKV